MEKQKNYVFGKNSVCVLLETNPKRIFKIFIAEQIKPDKRIDRIYALAQQHGIVIQRAPRFKLDTMVSELNIDIEEANIGHGNPNVHQGVVAVVAPKALIDLQQFLDDCQRHIKMGQFPLVLVLDGVTDPRNLGAILRVADGLGVDGVILPKHNSVGFTMSVSKSASGADETVNVISVGSLTHALESLKKIGFWVVGTMLSDRSQRYDKVDYKMPTVLVMGGEGGGIRPVIEKNCDFLVKIPMAGVVNSLNVSVATGVLGYEIRRAQGFPEGKKLESPAPEIKK